MRRKLARLFTVLTVLASATAAADIRTTPHSLVKKSVKSDASDVCVFCHTPNVIGKPLEHAPLWQRAIGTDLVFTTYDDIGRLGLGKDSVGSQSIACLSCHDSIQAAAISKTSADHPFGVPYRGAARHRAPILAPRIRAEAENDGSSIRAKALVALDDFRDASQGTVENRTVWWVSVTGNTARRTRSDLPLYQRHDEDSGQNVPFIECSSCHDPHSSNNQFLRLPNDGSRLCLSCHIK